MAIKSGTEPETVVQLLSDAMRSREENVLTDSTAYMTETKDMTTIRMIHQL